MTVQYNTVAAYWASVDARQQASKANSGRAMLSAYQVQWASSHDWFIDAGTTSISAIVVMDMDGPASWIGTFAQLKAWAGY